MPFVLDASVTACWHFPDERTEAATAVLDALSRDNAIVPKLWWFEIRNVLLLGERRGRATADQTFDFLGRLAQLPISLADVPDAAAVLGFARQHRLSFYDATYLELAKRENLALATLDGALAAAARSEKIVCLMESRDS